MSNWTSAVNAAIAEQADYGDFTCDGEMLICYDDPQEIFRIMAEKLDPDTLQEWLINNDEAMGFMLEAIRSKAAAMYWMQRIRSVLGKGILETHRDEIEQLHARNARQYAHDAYWDSKMEDMRDMG